MHPLLSAAVLSLLLSLARAQCDETALASCPAVTTQSPCSSFLSYEDCVLQAECSQDDSYLAQLAAFDQSGCVRPGSVKPSIKTVAGNIVLAVSQGKDVVLRSNGADGQVDDISILGLLRNASASSEGDTLADANAYTDSAVAAAEGRMSNYADAAAADSLAAAKDHASSLAAELRSEDIQTVADDVVATTAALNGVKMTVQGHTATIGEQGDRLTAAESDIDDLSEAMVQQAACASNSEDYSPQQRDCVPRPNPGVRPLPFPGSCTAAGTVWQKDDQLVVCDAAQQPRTFAPATPGLTPEVPLSSCDSLHDQHVYVLNGAQEAQRVYCHRGVALPHKPDFSAVGGPPVVYYPFESSLKDHAASFDLTLQDAQAEAFVDGRYGTGFRFETDTFLKAPFRSSIFHAAFTISFWAKFDEVPETGDIAVVGHGNEEGADQRSLHLGVRDGRFLFAFYGNDQQTDVIAKPNIWYHCVFVAQPDHARQVYINGAQLHASSGTGRYYGVGDLHLGAFSFSNNDRRLKGVLDEFLVFNRGFSHEQVAALSNSEATPLPPPAVTGCSSVDSGNFPAAVYRGLAPFGSRTAYCSGGDEAVVKAYQLPGLGYTPQLFLSMDNRVVDVFDRTTLALLKNTPRFTDGVNGKALIFPNVGSSGLVYNLGLPFTFFRDQYAWTVAMFVRFGRVGNEENVLLCEGRPDSQRNLHLLERGGRLFFGKFDDDYHAPDMLTANRWYHIAFVYEGRYMRAYIDGRQSGPGRGGSGDYIGPDNASQSARIGACGFNGNSNFFGDMDEFAIYNRALSDNEVALMAAARL